MEALYEVDEEVTTTDEDAKSETGTQKVEENALVGAQEDSATENEEGIDYEALITSDVNTLKAQFPELKGIKDITDLNNPLRYAALRDLGLTPEEAYMATAKRQAQDTRSHLRSAHGRSAGVGVGMMSQYELATARELFPGMSDSDLQRLYKKVTK